MVDSRRVADVPPRPATVAWIHDPAELDQWLADGAGEPLALDTEFERVSTFYPIPGLVQLGRGGRFCLVDPLVAEASAGFRQVLTDPQVPKLLYAMSEDLELFRHWLQLNPAGLLDLQIGAGLAGAGFSVGYARLVETLFGEALDKSVTRSDWIARPLSPAQERYAIDDVRFLVALHTWVVQGLEQKELVGAMAEESTRFAEELGQQDDPDNHYLKLRGGWMLRGAGLRALQALTRWRELECRKQDRPRSRILPDPVLIALAEAMPSSGQALSRIEGLPPVVVRKYGDRLLQLIAEAAASSGEPAPITPPLTREEQGTYKKVKRILVKMAEARDIPIEILAPRRRLEAVVHDGTIRTGLFIEGWRAGIVGPVVDEIEEILQS